MMDVFKWFSFEAAHRLPFVPESHKCSAMHGHSYRVEVRVTGRVNDDGFVQDFSAIKDAFRPLLEVLDHSILNQVAGLDNPTCEVIASWIWDRLVAHLPMLSMVTVWETATSGSSYDGRRGGGA